MSQINWEADKMLDVYIYDYLMKRNLLTSAKTFQGEGKVSSEPVAIDAPGGFLLEWWSVFWDIFIARTNENHSDVAASYTQTQLMKAREQQRMQMQHLLLQRQQQEQQQQWREGGRLLNGTTNGLAVNDSLVRQNPATANVLATKTYEEQLKLLLQSNPLDDTSMKQRCGDNAGLLLDPNHASMLKTVATEGQPPGKVLHGTAGGISGTLQQAQAWNQQLTGVAQDVKSDVNPVPSSKAAGPDGLLIGLPGSNQGGSNLTLKGWPLTGLDQLWSRLLQQQKSFMQSSQPFSQFQLLTPQQQQQLLLHAQSSHSSVGDIDVRRPRTLVNNRNIVLGKDVQSNLDGDVISNVGSPVQAACPVLPCGDAKMLRKVPSSLQNFSHFLGVEAEMELTNSRLSQ